MHAPVVPTPRRPRTTRPPELTIRLPARRDQTAFNLRRWAEVLTDPFLARVPGRVETNRFGQAIMSPPSAPKHGNVQSEIIHLLRLLLPNGRVISECPVSTADGVKGVDVAWISRRRWRAFQGKSCLPGAPEICVEVLSPSNSQREIEEKRALYFAAGADEVWICDAQNRMQFFHSGNETTLKRSKRCPKFPARIVIPD